MDYGTGLGRQGDLFFNLNCLISCCRLKDLQSIFKLEQTASLMVDNGDVLTGSSQGKLQQLNARAGLFLGKK